MRHLAFAGFILAAAAARAEEHGLTVLSDADWKCSTEMPAGWDAKELDDSKWAAAVPIGGPDGSGDHYKLPNVFGFPSKARWIWIDANERIMKVYFRRVLDVPAGFRRAEMIYIADDHAHVHINGEEADRYFTMSGAWGHRGCAVFLDLTPWLVEGRNVIAVEGIDDGGAQGFAAEIRIDGEPLVPRLRGGDEKLPEGTDKRLEDLVKEMEKGETREEATRKLFSLSRELGLSVAPVLDRLAGAAGDRDVAARLGQAIDAAVPQMMPVVPGDGRFAYGRLTTHDLRAHLFAEQEPGCLFRWAVSTQVRAFLEPDAVRKTVLEAAEDGTDLSAERAARFIGALDFEYGRETLLEVLKARPKTRAGAFAAAALMRLGKKEDAETLEKASKCGFAPTERAARTALRVIVK